MVIRAKYRDVPPECIGPAFQECHQFAKWGSTVEIVTPPADIDMGRSFLCQGPFYEVILAETHRCPYRHLRHYSCIHSLEIGD